MTRQVTYDVTDKTPQQRRQLLQACMNAEGFSAFIKDRNNQQTHYTFHYKN